MEEGDCYFGEEIVEEEGPEVAGGEVVLDNTVDGHQVLVDKPVRLRQFYFVKFWPFEDPKTDALIGEVERRIQMMNHDQTLIDQKIWDRMMDFKQVNNELSRLKYYDDGITLKWQREKLNDLHLKLDKLSFANNAYKGKPVHSCLSAGEVDMQKLSFLMGHGCKSMADEKKRLREINASQKKDGGTTIDELHFPIQRLKEQLYTSWGERKDINVDREKTILREIKQHEMARERAVANAAVNGKLWNSLGFQKTIQAEVLCNKSEELRERQLKVRAKIRKLKKELEEVERDIKLLQKRLADIDSQIDEAYNTILKLKKQYGEEVENFVPVEQLQYIQR